MVVFPSQRSTHCIARASKKWSATSSPIHDHVGTKITIISQDKNAEYKSKDQGNTYGWGAATMQELGKVCAALWY